MKLTYTNVKDEGQFILTNFHCAPSQQLLKDPTLYKIIWNQSDSIRVGIDGYFIDLKPNHLLLCTPLNILEIENNTNIIAAVFNREFYCIQDHDSEVSCNGFLFYGSSQPPIISLDAKENRSFSNMFEILKEEFETKDHIQGEMLRVLLKRMLITSSRLVKKSEDLRDVPKPQFDLLRQFHILVEQHYKKEHQVAAYADLLFKSPKTLSNVFKKMGNKSPLQIINERLLLEAKRLLIYSEQTAEEIAFELGFNDAGHFSKFFKKHTGEPPIGFKKNRELIAT